VPLTHVPVDVSHVSPDAQSASDAHPAARGAHTPVGSQYASDVQSASEAQRPPTLDTHTPNPGSQVSPDAQSASDAHAAPRPGAHTPAAVSHTSVRLQSLSDAHGVPAFVPPVPPSPPAETTVVLLLHAGRQMKAATRIECFVKFMF
jgi:hypothetical protein